MSDRDITIEVIPHNKHLVLTYRDDRGNLFKRVYIGYTRKEAKQEFRNFVTNEQRKVCNGRRPA